ncbi:MAG: DUF2341 domain-containing protein [Methanospirillaceae archaeon]|nr:DUF2341 domain-containing protein [Methanospirillaceae archaeon]
MLILFAVVLLTGAVWSSSAGGTEDAGTSLFANNIGDESTSLMAVAGSLLDLVTGPSTDSGPLPISDAGPVRGGTIYQGPVTDPVKNRYTIIASAGGGGSVSPSGQTSVTEGENLSFAITPDSGYETSAVLVDGENASALSTYQFSSVCADHQIEVRFRAVTDSGSGGVLEDGEIGALNLGLENGTPLVSEGLGSVSKTAVITIASDPPFYTEGGKNWQVRKAHTIRNPHNSAKTDYMVRFLIHRSSGADSGEDCYVGNLVQSDYRDLRFTSIDNSVVYSYIIEESDENQAKVWVTIPSLAANEGKQIYLYYGCPTANPGSGEGSITHDIFREDFETSTAAWTVDSGCSLTRVSDGAGGYVGRLVTVGSATGAHHIIPQLSDLTGDLTVEYSIKPAQVNQYVTGTTVMAPHLMSGAWFWFTPQATFFTNPPASNFGSYTANQWYTIKIVFKQNRVYDLYINNILGRQNVGFLGSGDLNVLSLMGYGVTSIGADFDNICVYRGEGSSPTPDAGVHYEWSAVQYNPEPVVPAFTFSPDPGIVYFPVFFTDHSTGFVLDRRWDFGDGSTTTGSSSVSHTYLSEGTRTVTLEVQNLTGSWSSVSHPVTVGAASGVTWNGTISVKTGTDQIDLTAGLHSAATTGYNPVFDEYTGFPKLGKTNAALDTIYLKRTKQPIDYGSSASWTLNIDVPAGKTATVTWIQEPLLTMEIKEGATVKTSGFTAAAGSHIYTVTVRWEPYSLSFRPGWNMISLPVVPADGRVSVVLSGVTSGVTNPVRTWNGIAFVPVTVMEPKKGYWAHSNTQVTIPISGTTIPEGSYSLSQGWNMVGTPGVTSLNIATIPHQVGERPAKTWSNDAFITVTQLESGKAAWVFVTESS